MSNGTTSGLAIAALVLGILGVCMPLFAPIGLILGIIALVKINGSNGHLKGQGLAIGGIATGGIGIFMIPVLAAIAIPNFIRYQLRSKQSEARVNLMAMKTGAESYSAANDAYPTADTGWVPGDPCGHEKCKLDAALWSQPPWSELGFSPRGDHYFQYRYTSDGASYSLEAQGDLDGDGELGQLRMTKDGYDLQNLTPDEF